VKVTTDIHEHMGLGYKKLQCITREFAAIKKPEVGEQYFLPKSSIRNFGCMPNKIFGGCFPQNVAQRVVKPSVPNGISSE
jgi:hypothetical protein